MRSVLSLIPTSAAPSAAPPAPLPASTAGGATVLMVRPLACLADGAWAARFTAGLGEELLFRLYRDVPPLAAIVIGAAGRQQASHVFEGMVRQDGQRMRVSLQLRDGDAGTLLWQARFDSAADASIGAQELLAERCVQALRPHLAGLGPVSNPAATILRRTPTASWC